ncbi:type II secretion system F family protein [Paenibacillus sp. GCM10027628]|uniref:type II secretion system F family protein n=1 Tax=Paenibacillus sp. GCM10027628 TaxID=3273413 RepID=UPI00363D2A6D
MLVFAKYLFLLLLFTLCYVFLQTMLQVLIRQRKARYRLHYVKQSTFGSRFSEYLGKRSHLYKHVKEMMESVESRLSMNVMMMLTFILFLAGLLIGALFFQTFKGVLVVTAICISLPYMMLRMKLMSVRLQTRLEFLPAVEVFYQYYMIDPNKNIKLALKFCLEEGRILYPIKPVFEQLYRNLMTQRETEESLRIFAITLGHTWADYFVGIIRVALTEGSYVGESLKELIVDMRKAQRADQLERNRLLEIRIANFTPIFFLALFLFINFKVNTDNAYLYYVVDPAGRNMLLDALLLIFVSFLMGIYLSLRRM